jgi:hypothetical protein
VVFKPAGFIGFHTVTDNQRLVLEKKLALQSPPCQRHPSGLVQHERGVFGFQTNLVGDVVGVDAHQDAVCAGG